MTRFGYTLMTEQSGPKDLVRYAIAAENAGYDFEVSSDHYSPWLSSQGHAPYAWSVLGAVAQATSRVELATYVTCPTVRYHPAVIAQKAATMQLLADGRFILGLGSGENLNEHAVGEGWPAVDARHDMLEEAVRIIRELHSGDTVTWEGEYFRVDSAKIWDLPDDGVPIGIAVSGPKSVTQFAPLADHFISTIPDRALVDAWRLAHGDDGASARIIGQLPICWGHDKQAAVERAHEQFRWFSGGWPVNANLPTPEAFAGASQFVRPEDVASSLACGPDLDELAESARAFIEAGYTDIAIVQVGDEGQDDFLAQAAGPLLDKLRALDRG
ncbi:TIGR03557 family F420-dependent LLM class oxidoreductase [Cryobacterium tepidiphilum]|uniref:TIGR03557 family F420-dependent LLM class oxidoreductase n=1 Tax=Cryobacterium tepidiphilum TaxID=2486026 RepID=A0A3M8L1P2_9MICO|nr:TIGR03557 family F420-dependent LLM class oxidoreductase [Cryobacterium tepidiphilum]RNE59286.1 TIGR03557 family F420-dependent LLM class oxidoreductase [Cryobacterium tepidiphilum]